MLKIDIKTSDIERLIKDLDVDEKETIKALKMALRQTSTALKTLSLRELSKASGIQQKILRPRIKTSVREQGLSAVIWYGLNPVGLIRLNPRQNKSGVQAGKIFRKSAFLVSIKSKTGNLKQQVFRRLSDKRLPIEKQTVDVERIASRLVEDIIEKNYFEILFKKMEQQLKWEISKR